MTRIHANTVVVKPTNNIYTALLGVGVVLELIAIVIVFVQYSSQFGKPLFGQ
jgi:hypothetical protein